jgi:hypothetical protein
MFTEDLEFSQKQQFSQQHFSPKLQQGCAHQVNNCFQFHMYVNDWKHLNKQSFHFSQSEIWENLYSHTASNPAHTYNFLKVLTGFACEYDDLTYPVKNTHKHTIIG